MDAGTGLDRLLEDTRARISRIGVEEAALLHAAGALFVDTRPVAQRSRHGSIPGSIAIERNHVEWRLEPGGEHRHPAVVGHEGPVVVYCQEGYSSCFPVDNLRAIGVPNVHELIGGVDAWLAAGLPLVPF